MIELLKVYIWRIIYYPRIRFKYWKSLGLRKRLTVLDSVQTIDLIVRDKYSVSRFGDGEFQMIDHYLNGGNCDNFPVDSFQKFDQKLATRLYEILMSDVPNHLVCIPYSFKESSISRFGARLFWEREWNTRKHLFQNNIRKVYGDTNFTRFYMDRKDIGNYPEYISRLRSIWSLKQVLIVEGEMSRLGVGNDLFDNTESIERILCPVKDAFALYDTILDSIIEKCDTKLILLALGHTATVLAFDLAKRGYWAIDIGHVDIEYEWYRMKANKKVAIPNKYVNEVSAGRLENVSLEVSYNQQIVGLVKA